MFIYGGGGSLNKLDSTRKKIRIHFDITVLVASGQKNYTVPRKNFNDGASLRDDRAYLFCAAAIALIENYSRVLSHFHELRERINGRRVMRLRLCCFMGRPKVGLLTIGLTLDGEKLTLSGHVRLSFVTQKLLKFCRINKS